MIRPLTAVAAGTTIFSGTLSTGTTTLNPHLGNYQYYTNNGAHTIAAPSSDCAIDILVTNGSSAGAITLSGFTAPSGSDNTFRIDGSRSECVHYNASCLHSQPNNQDQLDPFLPNQFHHCL